MTLQISHVKRVPDIRFASLCENSNVEILLVDQ